MLRLNSHHWCDYGHTYLMCNNTELKQKKNFFLIKSYNFLPECIQALMRKLRFAQRMSAHIRSTTVHIGENNAIAMRFIISSNKIQTCDIMPMLQG